MKRSRVALVDDGAAAAAQGPKSSAEGGVNPWNGKPFGARYRQLLEGRRQLPAWGFLDELRRLSRDGKAWIAKFQADEVTRTGINSLKVGSILLVFSCEVHTSANHRS